MKQKITKLRDLLDKIDTMTWCLETRKSPDPQETIKDHIESYFDEIENLKEVMQDIIKDHGSETLSKN